MVRFELKKVFCNRFFLGILLFSIFLNLFTLYESGKASKETEDGLSYNTYDEFVDDVQSNARKSLSVSIFNEGLSDFSKRNIEKTAEDFEKMRGIEIKKDIDDGVLIVLNSEISDFCILILLIAIGLSLITDEKEKRLFHLIRSTAHGTHKTIISKISALFICSVLINGVITASTAIFAFKKYGFGDIFRSIQSVPDMLTAFFKQNIFEYFLMLFSVKTIGIFIVGVVIFLLCLMSKHTITMILSVVLTGAVSFVASLIPDTSDFNFFRYINLYSLINPYNVLHSYVNLNIFAKPVNVIVVFALFSFLTGALTTTAVIVYFANKRPLENSDVKAVNILHHNKVHGNIMHFELKKLLSLNKATAIILVFILFQTYNVYTQKNFQSKDDYYYQYYMEMLSRQLTDEKEKIILSEKAKIDNAQEQQQSLNEQRKNKEITLQQYIQKQEEYSGILDKSEMFNKIFEKYLYIKDNPNAEFIYDIGYEKLFGISEQNFSLKNSMLLLCVFALCFCSVYSVDYKTDAYKILCTTKYGTDKTRKVKNRVLFLLSSIIFIVAYMPEIIYIGRFYGFPHLNAQLLSIPATSNIGILPIWLGVVLLYAIRFLIICLLISIISAISLKSKNNIITAILFCLIFVLPIAIYSFGKIEIMSYLSLWSLLSGNILVDGSLSAEHIILFIILISVSCVSKRFVRHNFGKSISKS